jgi:hypothetical protein
LCSVPIGDDRIGGRLPRRGIRRRAQQSASSTNPRRNTRSFVMRAI